MKTCVVMLTKARSVYKNAYLPDVFKYHAKFRVIADNTKAVLTQARNGAWHLPANSFVVIKDDPNVKILS